jgi:hypothetical protein
VEMIIKIPSNLKGHLTESEAAKIALEKFADTYYEDGERYSPTVKLIGTYYVNYNFGDDPYVVYEFECIENMQINNIELSK